MFIFPILKLGMDFIAGRALALFNMKMQIAAFIIDRWRVILPLAILCLALLHVHSLRNQVKQSKADKIIAQKALNDYVEANSQAAKKREAENKLNAILLQKKTDADLAKHKSQLALVISKGKSNEAISNRSITNYRDGLRLAIQREEAARLLKNDTDRLAEGSGNAAIPRPISECEAEVMVCKEAGAIAAADYNLCKSYVDNQQSIIGVTND